MLFAYTGKVNKIRRAPGVAMIVAYIAFLATKLWASLKSHPEVFASFFFRKSTWETC